MRFLLSH